MNILATAFEVFFLNVYLIIMSSFACIYYNAFVDCVLSSLSALFVLSKHKTTSCIAAGCFSSPSRSLALTSNLADFQLGGFVLL